MAISCSVACKSNWLARALNFPRLLIAGMERSPEFTGNFRWCHFGAFGSRNLCFHAEPWPRKGNSGRASGSYLCWHFLVCPECQVGPFWICMCNNLWNDTEANIFWLHLVWFVRDLVKLHVLGQYSRGRVCTCRALHSALTHGDCVSNTESLYSDVQLFSYRLAVSQQLLHDTWSCYTISSPSPLPVGFPGGDWSKSL